MAVGEHHDAPGIPAENDTKGSGEFAFVSGSPGPLCSSPVLPRGRIVMRPYERIDDTALRTSCGIVVFCSSSRSERKHPDAWKCRVYNDV